MAHPLSIANMCVCLVTGRMNVANYSTDNQVLVYLIHHFCGNVTYLLCHNHVLFIEGQQDGLGLNSSLVI